LPLHPNMAPHLIEEESTPLFLSASPLLCGLRLTQVYEACKLITLATA